VLAIGLSSEIGMLLVKLSRDVTGQPFSSDSAERLGGIAHHVRQAVVIDRSLRRRMESDSFAAAIVNRLRAAVIRLDDRLQVTFANQAAYRLANERNVLAINDRGLRFVEREAMETLRSFVRKATAADSDLSETILLTSGENGRRVRVWAWSTMRHLQHEIGLVILPDDYDPEVLEAMLLENYGLTPSEIRTAVGVLSHNGLAAVAQHTGVSVETVRFHMKRIFSKTGTRRQSELVRVIANDLSCIDPGAENGSGDGRF
jgi:DNA-binding CsgD family transcriptional regulator